MAEQAYWYVVHTYSGYENKVATDLMTMVENRRIQDLICDVKVPTETVMEDQFDKTGNKIGEKEVQRKIYPGYVFVKMVMNDNTWYIVRNTRGCTGFVGPASKPEPLSEEEVAKLGVDNGVAALGCDTLAFGAETPEPAPLQAAAAALCSAAFPAALRSQLERGLPSSSRCWHRRAMP